MRRISPIDAPPRNELMAFLQGFFDEMGNPGERERDSGMIPNGIPG